MLGSSMPKHAPELKWVLSDPETSTQYLCGFEVVPRDGCLFKRVLVAVCQRKTDSNDLLTLDGDVILDGLIRTSDLKFIPKKER